MADVLQTLPARCILMLEVALKELRSVEAEGELGKIRIAMASVEKTLTELLEIATEADVSTSKAGPNRD